MDEFVHSVLIDEQERDDGWHVNCVPHGHVGKYSAAVEAFLAALEHDFEFNGTSST